MYLYTETNWRVVPFARQQWRHYEHIKIIIKKDYAFFLKCVKH